jgi:glycerol uptake facilitator-like aquaporin
LKVFFAEAIATFIFISFVLMIKKHNGAQDCAPINSLAIGMILFLSMTMVSGISGGCINPVIGLLQSNFQKFCNTTIYPSAPETSLIYVPAYIFGPLFGGFIAGNFHKWIHEAALNSADDAKNVEEGYGEMIQ